MQTRIAEAKKKAEMLKSEIARVRESKQDGTMSKALTGKNVPSFGNLPKARRFLKGHFGKVYAMHWAGDSQQLVSASQDGKLIVWNAMTTNKVQAIPLRSSWVMTCAYEQSQGQLVACGGLDNLCSVYMLNQPQVMRAHKELAAHDGYLSCCRFVNDQKIITSSGDSSCILWDIERGEPIDNFTDHVGDVMSVAISPDVDPNIFVSGSCDSTAKVWDIRNPNACSQTFHGHESDINSVSLFPDGKSFGTGSDDSSCRLFDMRSYGEVQMFSSHKILCGITSVAFSRSGRILFAGYDDYNCNAWDVLGAEDDLPVFLLNGHENRVSCLGVNKKGEALCTGSWDTLLKIWA